MILVKVTLLILGALGTTALLHRKSAALRHLIWTLALGGSTLLVVVSPIAPRFHLMVPAWDPPIPHEKQSEVSTVADPRAASPNAVLPKRSTIRSSPAVMSPFPPSSSDQAWSTEWLIPVVYGLGCCLVIGWCIIGRWALTGLAGRATPLTGPEWTHLLKEQTDRSGVTRPVRLFRTAAVGSPVTWGWRRPVVLFPAGVDQWPEERRRVVLAHEVAHIARGDYLSHIIGSIACAVYWFHPLVWFAFRRLGAEGERAADDQVLAGGTSGIDYAAELLEIARHSRTLRRGALVAIGMARPSQLEGRLLAVLDQHRQRAAIQPRAIRAAWGGMLLSAIPLAGLSLVFKAPERPPLDLRAVTITPADPATAFKIDSTFERTVSARPGEVLDLDLQTGGDVQIQGWDQPSVLVRVHLAGHDWRDTRVSIERRGAAVQVLSEQTEKDQYSTSHEFDIMVPRRFDVRLRSGGGSLTITDLEGTFRGQTGGGDMTLTQTKGEAQLSTGGGEIEVSDSDLRGTVTTGGGQVRLSRVKGGLRGSSGSGPVIYTDAGKDETGDLSQVTITKHEIRVADQTVKGKTGVLHIKKAGGEIILNGAPDGAELSTGGGQIRVGTSGGTVHARTGGGDITIGPVAGSVEAGTGAGEVRISLSRADGTEQSVEVWSGTGEVVIELPDGLDVRFDLETAYTRRFGRVTRIQSDWELKREETEDWDSSEGTPRKYVRGTSEGRRGAGIIRVKTVNGDITIRRISGR